MNHTRIGSHKAIHICPYLKHLSIERCSYYRCGVIASATPKICNFSRITVCTDKSWHNGNLSHILESLANKPLGKFTVENILAMLVYGFYKFPRIISLRIFYKCCHYMTTQSLPITYYCSLDFRTEVMNKINTVINRAKFLEEIVYDTCQIASFLTIVNNGIDHIMMTSYHRLKLGFVRLITTYRHFRGSNKLVGNATEGTYDNDEGVVLPFDNLLQA